MQYNLSHSKLLTLCGLIWLCIGAWLLKLGIHFILFGLSATGFSQEGYSSFFPYLATSVGSVENGCILLIALGIFVGFVKGNMVMKKAAHRSYERISKLTNPAPLFSLYSKANYLILLVMMGLGFTMKFLSVAYDVRGLVDTAVGIALIQGAVHYFRFAKSVQEPVPRL